MRKSNLLREKLPESQNIYQSKWWRNSRKCQLITIEPLCCMCHRQRVPPPGFTASAYSKWCDECFVELPLWLKFGKPTALELENLRVIKKEDADRLRDKREAKKESTKVRAKSKQRPNAKSKSKAKVNDNQPMFSFTFEDKSEK